MRGPRLAALLRTNVRTGSRERIDWGPFHTSCTHDAVAGMDRPYLVPVQRRSAPMIFANRVGPHPGRHERDRTPGQWH